MASIPLPALHIAPQQPQENPLDQAARLMQLKTAMQNAPLQRQALQQQVQAGALENQQRQVALQNQQAMTKAYQGWDGKSYDDLAHRAVQAGATGDAVMALQQHALQIRDTASQIAQRDAETGQKNLQTKIDQNGLIAGKIASVSSLPDNQLAQGVASALQELGPQLDPQHAQTGAQLVQGLQTGQIQPAQARQALDIFRKGFLSDKQIMEDTKSQADADAASAKAEKDRQESQWYKDHPGSAPGVPVEAQQQADWLAKNPGKGPSDFLAWKAKQAPLAQFNLMNNTGNGGAPEDVAKRFGMSAAAFDQQAEKYATTGQLPPSGRGGPALAFNKAIMNRAAELHPDGSLAANSAEYRANTESLKALQKNFDAVQSFENTANKNINMLTGLAAKVPDLGARFANVPIRMLSGSMIGSENMAAFKTALAPVQAESAKILNSANLNGQLSDSSRHELQDIVDGNLPYKSLVSSLNVLQQDFKNRHDSMADQIADIQRRLGGKSGGGSQQPQTAQPLKITLPSGKQISIE